MKAVFGLGNPGLNYALTRHNVGFEVIDYYRKLHCIRTKGRIEHSALVYSWNDLLLVKPMTYMNESGASVRGILSKHRIPTQDALIVYDDLDLPLGRVKMLAAGGPGSHKGMTSVVERLGTEDVPRLRIGIEVEGRDASGREYVLERFGVEEWGRALPAIERAAEAIELFREAGIDAAMTRVNRTPNLL